MEARGYSRDIAEKFPELIKKRSPRYRKQKYIPVKINKRNQHLDI